MQKSLVITTYNALRINLFYASSYIYETLEFYLNSNVGTNNLDTNETNLNGNDAK